MSWLKIPTRPKECDCTSFEFYEINGKKFKKCNKCGQEFRQAYIPTWLRVDSGTIDKAKEGK